MANARPVVPPASAALAGTMSAADKAKLDAIPAPANGTAVLGSAVTLTATHPTYQAAGLAVALPAAGTYLIALTARFDLDSPSGAGVNYKLRDTTHAADVPGGGGAGYYGAALAYLELTADKVVLYTVAGAATVELYANGQGSAAGFTIQPVNSSTALSYVRIA